MTSPWSELKFSAGGAIEALASTSVQVVEAYARGRIELARAELRQGNIDEGVDILQRMMNRLQPVSGATSGGLDLTSAVALSVLGQGLEQNGEVEYARVQFAESVEQFRELLPDAELNARDHSDFGIALAVIGAEEEGLHHLHLARVAGGSTPEAARHLAAILLDHGDGPGAEGLLSEALLTTPTDAEALRMLARIQARRGDSESLGTLTSAAYSLLIRGRNHEALEILDLIEEQSGTQNALAGVRAEALRLDDQPSEALAHYARALKTAPDSPWLLAGSASALLAIGHHDEAREAAERALVNAADDVDLLNLAADIALQIDDWEAAADFARRAIAADPHSAQAHHRLATAARGSGELEPALEAIRMARLLDPQEINLLILHGELETEVGSLVTAAEVFRQICAHSGATPAAHAELASLLGRIGQPEQGVAAAESALDKFGDTPQVLVVISELLLRLDRPLEAAAHLRRATALEDRPPYFLVLLARALVEANDIDGAIEQAEHAIQEVPEWVMPYAAKAEAFARDGRWVEAADAAEAALARDPLDVDALSIGGLVRLSQGDTKEAERLLREATRLDPDSPQVQFHLAQAVTRSRPKEAILLLDSLIEEMPTVADLVQTRGRAWMELGNHTAAITDLDKAVELNPADATIWMDLADATRLSGDRERAIESANRALELAPTSGPALLIRSSVHRALGRPDEARADLWRAIEFNDRDKDAYLQLCSLTTNFDEAQGYLARARELAPGDRLIDIEQANLYLQHGRPAEALELYDELIEGGREAEVLTGRLDALRMLDRVAEAVQFAEVAVVERDNDPALVRGLGIALVDAGRVPEGIDVLRRLAETVGDASSTADLGWALLAEERTDEALALFDQALLAAPPDLWTLNQTSRLLSEVGEFEQAASLATWALGLETTSGEELAETWIRLGWAAQHLDPPDSVRGELAFDRAWALKSEDEQDPWVLTGRADSRLALGDPRARDDYLKALELAKSKTPKGTWPLSTIGWCQYRLGNLRSAARTFLEVRSIEEKPGSDAFDLALVTLCHGRHKRSQQMYADAVRLLDARHPLVRRGLLEVAITDLVRARVDFPDVESTAALPDILTLLRDARTVLPVVEPLRFMDEVVRQQPLSDPT